MVNTGHTIHTHVGNILFFKLERVVKAGLEALKGMRIYNEQSNLFCSGRRGRGSEMLSQGLKGGTLSRQSEVRWVLVASQNKLVKFFLILFSNMALDCIVSAPSAYQTANIGS